MSPQHQAAHESYRREKELTFHDPDSHQYLIRIYFTRPRLCPRLDIGSPPREDVSGSQYFQASWDTCSLPLTHVFLVYLAVTESVSLAVD